MRAPRQGKEPSALCGARLIPSPFCAVSLRDPLVNTKPAGVVNPAGFISYDLLDAAYELLSRGTATAP